MLKFEKCVCVFYNIKPFETTSKLSYQDDLEGYQNILEDHWSE